MLEGSNIAAAATGTNNYLMYSSVNLRNNVANITLTDKETVYIKGNLNGNTFTVNSLTTTIPTTDDGFYYISLGLMYSTYQCGLFPEHPIFKYVNGEFKSLNQVAYEAQSDIDNLEVGGRNLLENSSGNLKNVNGWEDNYLEGDAFDPEHVDFGGYVTYQEGDGYMNFPYLHYVRDLTSETKRSTLSNISIGDKINSGDH